MPRSAPSPPPRCSRSSSTRASRPAPPPPPAGRPGAAARLDNSGQSCNAAKRFIVADELYEPFLEKFTAKIAEIEATDPTSAGSALGPLSSLKAAEGLDEQVRRAIEHGATLVHGGTRDGAFFQTTVLTDVTPEHPH